jgi:hypothetical protein
MKLNLQKHTNNVIIIFLIFYFFFVFATISTDIAQNNREMGSEQGGNCNENIDSSVDIARSSRAREPHVTPTKKKFPGHISFKEVKYENKNVEPHVTQTKMKFPGHVSFKDENTNDPKFPTKSKNIESKRIFEGQEEKKFEIKKIGERLEENQFCSDDWDFALYVGIIFYKIIF